MTEQQLAEIRQRIQEIEDQDFAQDLLRSWLSPLLVRRWTTPPASQLIR